MPGGDSTGPTGRGPRTGRAMGYCSGYGAPGFANPGFGHGRGMGFGRGHRHRYYAADLTGWADGPYGQTAATPQVISKEQELTELKNQAKHLQTTLKKIESRITDLESKTEKE